MRILFLFLSLALSATCMAQDLSVDFIDNKLEDALAKAASEDKIVFVDAYTTWCGPCKMMDRDVFSDQKVAEFFNENFVNLKLDMEKGDGNNFRRKYGVRGFPSFLFLNSAGTVVHRGLGYQPSEQFLQLGAAALDPKRQTASLAQEYDRGNRDPELLLKYANALFESGDPKGAEVGAAYLETQEKWSSKENMAVVANLMKSFDDPYFKYVVEKRHLFISEFGTERIDAQLSSVIDNHVYSNSEDVDLDEVKTVYEQTFPTNKAAKSYALFEVDYYKQKGREKLYAEKATEFLESYPAENWNTYNSMAWGFYEDVSDRKQLKKAVKWAKKSIALNANSFNTDTIAALYYKLGKRKPARKWAEQAIALAQANGMDYAETSQLLKKIDAM